MDGRGYPLYFVSQVEDITERKLLEEKLQTRSVTDDLTGLYNRRGFFELCQEKLSIASRRNERLLLLFVDLDHMKWINDTLGHDEGDAALIAVAQTLRDTFRGSDIIGRIGGDEFAILAVGPSEDAENTFLTRLQDNLTTFNKTNDRRDFPISVSAGISRYEPIEPCSLEALIAQADQRMYEVKREKKRSRSYHANRIVQDIYFKGISRLFSSRTESSLGVLPLHREFVLSGVDKESPWKDLKATPFLCLMSFVDEIKDSIRATSAEIQKRQRHVARPSLENIVLPPADATDRQIMAARRHGYSLMRGPYSPSGPSRIFRFTREIDCAKI